LRKRADESANTGKFRFDEERQKEKINDVSQESAVPHGRSCIIR
jgi:hypothetical protein